MVVLTAIIQAINSSVCQLPRFALHSICRVALLVSPRREHRQNASLEDCSTEVGGYDVNKTNTDTNFDGNFVSAQIEMLSHMILLFES